ncbi:unnamed protein product [Parascedosporium putredinis]|uniref:SET domain-containing protein n=1 Tax=Parascedosporium putredinis TaxID=1442378 RepID=A0A9P1HCX3_9PEZI|nr:unnamed protein product [Parascedosporium putredinis]CAI8004252.1 unnamed protein product [Parascedosporium putredinis]
MDEPQPMPLRQDSETATRRRYRWQWWNRDVHDEVSYLTTVNYSVKERESQILRLVDDNGFNVKVFLVAASGFLASSYGLFATNVVTPAINYIYPACGRLGSDSGSVIDLLTLVGTTLGMLVVGHLADRAGRKRLYGFELSVLMLEDGVEYQGSMNMYAWIAWWRTILGFGIGAEYPISAIITAEWASTESRGTMLAAVKSMQSLARILAASVGLGFLRQMTNTVWRWVIGIALLPAAIAILARLTIPETPRYYVDIMKDLRKAVRNALQVYKTRRVQETNPPLAAPRRSNSDTNDHWYRGAWAYLNRDSRKILRRLVAITVLWGLVNTPRKNDSSLLEESASCPDATNWRATSEPPDTTIYRMLELNSQRSLEVVSIASILGNIVAILLINRFERRRMLAATFATSALLFIVTGATLLEADRQGKKPTVSLVFYALTHFVYNLGPNTLIFVIAAEIFPTVYRSTFYGIAAAGGRLAPSSYARPYGPRELAESARDPAAVQHSPGRADVESIPASDDPPALCLDAKEVCLKKQDGLPYKDPWTYYTETRPAPLAGLGVFAVRDIPKGTRLTSEAPLLSVPAVPNDKLYAAVCEDFTLKVIHASEIRRNIIQWYLDLPSPIRPYANVTELDALVRQTCRRYAIFLTNNLDMGPGAGAGVFPRFSRMNHSCTPNIFDAYNPASGRLTVHAARFVAAGEQLHSAYVEPLWPRSRRVRKLRAWGFECACAACSDESLGAAREEAFALDDELAEYVEWLEEPPEGEVSDEEMPYLASSEDAWRAAQRMLAILREQGLSGDALFSAYRYCSRIKYEQGDLAAALQFGRKAREHEICCVGIDGPSRAHSGWDSTQDLIARLEKEIQQTR